MRAHRMYLKGPWECQWVTPREPQPEEDVASRQRVRMPADWQSLFGSRGGSVRFRRRFGRPTNLESHERVYLVFDGVGGRAVISLNDRPLGTINQQAGEFEVTDRLLDNNYLAVEIEFHPQDEGEQRGGLWGPVALEVRATTG